jgi:hypothetical protein
VVSFGQIAGARISRSETSFNLFGIFSRLDSARRIPNPIDTGTINNSRNQHGFPSSDTGSKRNEKARMTVRPHVSKYRPIRDRTRPARRRSDQQKGYATTRRPHADFSSNG